ncbi:Sulphatase-modifying factor domain protein [Candidatus Thiomargarita nelsonii]|uniref:Sulphatase-modifying factor domain protein n=1 Tax=Candidatus Thiomargarita nelsonii TaxID=1003181 RepID=A0A176RV48_9GAMM|nr:Sulphatase-modifying factor domain protein [Candidatus Thiomargarita nelsonii]
MAQQYLSLVPEIKKVMGDPALRQAEAMAAKTLLDKAEKEQFEKLDEYIEILSSKGKVFEKELHTLATEFPKILKADIRRRIKVSIVKDQAQKTEPLDKTTANVISDALIIVEKSSLYDFLAVLPSSSLNTLQAQIQKKDLEIKQVAHKNALITASSVLIGQCQNIFKTSKMREAYDATLAQERFAELNKAIDVVGSSGHISYQEYQHLVKKAVGLVQDEARQYILEYCHKNNYLVELPPDKPNPQIDEPPLIPRWVWGGVGLLSLVFLAVWLMSPSKVEDGVSQALTQEQIAELEKQKAALKQQQLNAEAKAQEQIAELEKQKVALKQQQEKLKQQQAELEKQRAQLSVSSPPSDAEKLSGLLSTCKAHFEANRLTTGSGGTAFDCYKEVLKTDPSNAEALRGLKNIEDRYVTWIAQAKKRKKFAQVKMYLESLRQVNPDSPSLAQLEEQQAPVNGTGDKVFRDRLKDGSLGPEMVWIPAGSFRMGDIQGGGHPDEKPVHSVSITQRFAMGRYEVTFAEYDKFAEATGGEKPSDRGWGRGNRPVINVSWHDAVAYAEWLSVQTGKEYRLPMEAEWEYAARAGTETKYWWGNDIGENKANCDNGDRFNYTAPVGSFAPNPFGIYDTAGNVWEWTCSPYTDRYNGQEQLCVNSASPFVLRGGSWNSGARRARPADRNWRQPTERSWSDGFRLASNP